MLAWPADSGYDIDEAHSFEQAMEELLSGCDVPGNVEGCDGGEVDLDDVV